LLKINDRNETIQLDGQGMPLLYALGNDLGLHSPRFDRA